MVYEGNVLRVSEEIIGGHTYERVYFCKGGIVVVPINDKGKIFIIKEKRVHEKPNIRWKLVTGFYESEYDVIENANRELQEELGYKAKSILPYFKLESQGTINTIQHYVVATYLQKSSLPNPDGDDVIIDVREISLNDLMSELMLNKFPMGNHSVGLFYLYYQFKNNLLPAEIGDLIKSGN